MMHVSMLRTMYMCMEQGFALNTIAGPQAGALAIATSPIMLGRNGDFRFMMLFGVRGSRLVCPAPSDTCTTQA